MGRAWVTCSSTNVEAMVNPINAACEEGFVPTHLSFVENPDVERQVAEAVEYAEAVVRAYGGDAPEVAVTALDEEVAFDRIRTHVKEAIEAANERGDEVAVDITPGRKFMSAIAFAAGMRYDADHVFYFYLASSGYRGRFYPELPRSAVRLYDFTEDG